MAGRRYALGQDRVKGVLVAWQDAWSIRFGGPTGDSSSSALRMTGRVVQHATVPDLADGK